MLAQIVWIKDLLMLYKSSGGRVRLCEVFTDVVVVMMLIGRSQRESVEICKSRDRV